MMPPSAAAGSTTIEQLRSTIGCASVALERRMLRRADAQDVAPRLPECEVPGQLRPKAY
jgi:hypothetical protein